MNLLLDTHALLWFVGGDDRLSRKARKTIEHPKTINYISMASWWEISIKSSLGKLILHESLDTFIRKRLDEGFVFLPIDTAHLSHLVSLPFHHRDPFDRLIICQGLVENMAICTSDQNFGSYPVKIIW